MQACGKNTAVKPKSKANNFDTTFLQGLSPEVLAKRKNILKKIWDTKGGVEQKHSKDLQNKDQFLPEVIAGQEHILQWIKGQKAWVGHLAKIQTTERVQLSIWNAIFCQQAM